MNLSDYLKPKAGKPVDALVKELLDDVEPKLTLERPARKTETQAVIDSVLGEGIARPSKSMPWE